MRLTNTWFGVLAILVVAAGLGIYFQGFSPGNDHASTASSPATPGVRSPDAGIGALGRIEPEDGVIRLGARSLSGQPSLVGKLLVREGDAVKTGQILAELDATQQLRAMYELGEARVEVARKHLEQVQAGAKPSDIAAQRAEIDRLQMELENAQKNVGRYQVLREANSIAESDLDDVRTRAESLNGLLRQANERLISLSEVRPVDVAVAKAELDTNIREVARARAELAASLIRSPLDGRVIKVHAWPGEEVGPDGVMEIAKTTMYVLADVSETDMTRVRPGQRATITAQGLRTTLSGTVETVGLKVTQDSVLKLDPTEFSDARVVEAKIRLDDGESVANLIHLRVKVVIEPSSSGTHRPERR